VATSGRQLNGVHGGMGIPRVHPEGSERKKVRETAEVGEPPDGDEKPSLSPDCQCYTSRAIRRLRCSCFCGVAVALEKAKGGESAVEDMLPPRVR
jgi:hypothetical protein